MWYWEACNCCFGLFPLVALVSGRTRLGYLLLALMLFSIALRQWVIGSPFLHYPFSIAWIYLLCAWLSPPKADFLLKRNGA